ncbi:hypothetical protein [Sphingobacterium siyangense]|uniref:hypothetical protein n=1 Tax=Sphingobacterium siyangense TaxID=459529 RepID=UPI003DA3B032
MTFDFDITTYHKLNVIDTCSIWNILACPRIYSATIDASCYFSFTEYVHYECLFKKRSTCTPKSLQNKLKTEVDQKRFMKINLSIDDLQEISLLENRKKLGMGELSSIALAKKTKQVFFTDDKKARQLGEQILGKENVQTTPRLVGAFFYQRILADEDLNIILEQHKASLNSTWGDLTPFFKEIYKTSLERRALNSITNMNNLNSGT